MTRALYLCLYLPTPFLYQVKTQLQAQSAQAIAVGYQHKHTSFSLALVSIVKEHGIQGLWRGVSGAVARVGVGSATQLSTFSTTKEFIINTKVIIFFNPLMH